MLLFDMTEEEYEDLRRRAHERQMREAVERERERGIEIGEERGEKRGIEIGEERDARLVRELRRRGRESEALDAMEDPELRAALYAELGIE